MKRFIFHLAFLAVVLCGFLSSCGDDDNESPDVITYLGTWKQTNSDGTYSQFTFNEDNTGVYEDNLNYAIYGDVERTSFMYFYDESTKTLTLKFDGYSLHFKIFKLTSNSIGWTCAEEDDRIETWDRVGSPAKNSNNNTVAQSDNGVENGHAYVDLGLPSGLKWATMNVGASSAEEYGNYYAWGETEPQSNNTYYWSSYKWCNGTYRSMTKYCVSSEYGIVDGKTTLEASDDAASVNWGGKWRMPTHAEQTELVNNCYLVWTSSYNSTGKAGYIIYKAKSSSDKGQVVTSGNPPSSSYSLSDSHIFLPAAGYRNDGSLYNVGSDGYYWSSSLYVGYGGYGMCAWRFYFYYGGPFDRYGYGYCCDGRSVRAVCEK